MNLRHLRPSRRCRALLTGLNLCFLATAAQAQPRALLIDDFESGTAAWTLNDKPKTDNPAGNVLLVDVLPTRPGAVGSQGAGLFTFRAGHASWASASRRVDGAAWAAIGAQRLTLWLNGDGHPSGTELMLRGRYRGPDGAGHDEVFTLPKPIRLDISHWRKVVIPLSDFKSPQGALASHVRDLYLMQFVQRGTWDSRFFSVDQIQVEGTGFPAPPPRQPPPATAGAEKINVDFLQVQGRVRSSANVSIGGNRSGATMGYPLTTNRAFSTAVSVLHPRFVRLDAGALSDLVDSSRPAFGFARLEESVRQVRALGAEPLIALPNPAEWGLDVRGYGLFVGMAARSLSHLGPRPPRYYELATGGGAAEVALYNQGRAALLAVSRSYRIGGMTAGSGATDALRALLAGARGLDFLSVQYYAANADQPSAGSLFTAAGDIPELRAAAAALDASRWRNAPLYVTAANLNNARRDGGGVPTDGRTVTMASAAWWAVFLESSARVVDEVFHNDAATPEWGFLDENGRAYPAYYAMWMWNTYFPPGCRRASARSNGGPVVAAAANTATAHNVLLVNTADHDTTVQLSIRGFPVLHLARIRVFDDPQQVVRMDALPKSPYQTIRLKPYAVMVAQFIEPVHPKKR